MDKIKEWWQNYSIKGSPDFIFSQKLTCLKKDITDWNREIFGKMETRKSKALDELMVIEQAIEKRIPSQAEKDKMMVLKWTYNRLLRLKKYHGGKNPSVYGLRRVIETPNIFKGWQTLAGGTIYIDTNDT